MLICFGATSTPSGFVILKTQNQHQVEDILSNHDTPLFAIAYYSEITQNKKNTEEDKKKNKYLDS